jgi:tetratricopeptide (TPR) repeat protein
VSVLEERRRAARSSVDVERERAATLRLVEVLVSQRKIAQARKALSEWVARVGDDVAALQRTLELCQGEGDTLGVAEAALRMVALSEGDAQVAVCRQLVEAAAQIERFDLARTGLETALAVHSDRPELRAALRSVYEQTSAYHELAQLLLEDASRIDDESELARLLKQAGHYQLAGGQTVQALQTLRDALACAPNDSELIFLLVDAHIEAGELTVADALLDESLPKLNGRRPELYQHARRKARLAEATGERKVQLAWLTEASKYEKDPHLVLEIADLAEALEDWDAAEKALRNTLLTREDSPIGRSELYVRQARVWMVRGDNKRALILARKAQKEEPNSAEVITLLRQLGAA